MTQQLNFIALQEFIQSDASVEPDIIYNWYQKLSEYDLDGSESPTDVQLLHEATKYVMSFYFTAAEEEKRIAEKEAIERAEKEDAWEEQRQTLKASSGLFINCEEIDDLRERITTRADAGGSSEAFRAQVDSLKEENRQLQQAARDRDREMADQRDRFESLASRVEMLTRERDSLSGHRVQLEDTIRQLNRRISSKSEDQSSEWETRKLRIRNEQAITLSRQMQAVVAQNEELRGEVHRVSDALEDATQLIEESAQKYAELLKSYEEAKDMMRELTEESERLAERIQSYETSEGEAASKQADSIEKMQKLIDDQLAEIRQLQDELTTANTEVAALQAMIREDRSAEKEAELEKLKDELVKATKTARTLFGEALVASTQGHSTSADPTVQLQMRILQLEHGAQQLRETINEKVANVKKLEEMLEDKENLHAEIASELERLKERKFGDARSEINRLETQLKFRDAQIAKLTNQCTMLQVELGRYAELGIEPSKLKGVKSSSPEKQREVSVITDESEKSPDKKSSTVVADKDGKVVEKETIILEKSEDEETSEKETRRTTAGKPKRVQVYGTVAEQSLLIANLYSEIMYLLEELEGKDKQLGELENSARSSKKSIDDVKIELKLAYEQIESLEKSKLEISEKMIDEMQKIDDAEMKRLVESIQIGGTEMERRLAEVTRKFISEKVHRIRLSRRLALLQKKYERADMIGKKAVASKNHLELQNGRKLAKLQYQLDTSFIDVARLQASVINSVPLEKYEALLAKYKQNVSSDAGLDMNLEDRIITHQNLELSDKFEEKTAEWLAKEKMLKKMNEVLMDQNDFWTKEVEILQNENEELKKFIEDIENESDLKSVMGAIETRLLDTIREMQDNLAEQRKEKRKKKDHERDRIAEREQTRQQQMRLFSAIKILQRENTALRAQSLGTVSLQQVEILKRKIIEARQKEIEIEDRSRKIEEIEERRGREEMRERAGREARELIDAVDGQLQGIHVQLQNALQNAALLSAKNQGLDKTIKLKEHQLDDIREELEELKKWNEEKSVLIESLKNWSIVMEVIEAEDTRTKIDEKKDRDRTEVDIEHQPKTIPEESDYEMDMMSETSDELSQRERIVVKTIVQDNARQFEARIAQMKEAAEVAMRGYKEQLAQRDAAIETYKELLLNKINESPVIVEKDRRQRHGGRKGVEELPEPETEKALRDAISEINRLNIELKELEESNRSLARDRKRAVPLSNAFTQTATEGLPDIKEESESSRSGGGGGEDDAGDESAAKRPSDRSNSSIGRATEKEQRLISELDLNEADELASAIEATRQTERYKMEIRTLKSRLQRLTQTNKNLLTTCEKIREDALQELEAKRSESDNMNERRNAELKVELDKLRRRNVQLRKSNDELNKEVEELRRELADYDKEKKIDTAEWHRRKKLEESLDAMRKRLNEAVKKEQAASEVLARKELRMEDMRREQETRQLQYERLNRRLRISTKERDEALINVESSKSIVERNKVLEEKLQRRERELSSQQQAIRKLQSELGNFRSTNSELMKRVEDERRAKIELAASRMPTRASAKSEHRSVQTEFITDSVAKRRLNDRTSQVTIDSSEKRARTIDVRPKLSTITTQTSANGNQQPILVPSEAATSTSTIIEEIVVVKEKDEISSLQTENLRIALNLTEQKLRETTRKLEAIEQQYSSLEMRYHKLSSSKAKLEDESRQLGAVTILADKLEAKDKEILKLKRHINELESRLPDV